MSAPPQETYLEKGMRKCTEDPLVPLGAIITVGFLLGGLRAFRRGGRPETQQFWMRGRVLAQFGTVLAMSGVAFAGFKPHDRPKTMEEKMVRMEEKK